jgi:carboxylesterase
MVKGLYKKVKGVLFADPELLYKEERQLINQPFQFSGTNGKAVLLIHGWTAVPYEVRRLGQYLNENGYTVSGPMLTGHGTVPEDLENVKWQEWLNDIRFHYHELKKNHRKVYVVGTSIGSNLAILLAEEYPEISGLVLMAMPYGVKFEKVTIFLARLVSLFKKYNRKFYPPTFGLATTITRLIAYKSYPIKSALETFQLIKRARKNLSFIKQPCLIMQSTSDHVVSRNSCEKIYANIGSTVKQKKYIKRAYHTFISDIKNENVFEDILNFIEKN